MNCFYHPGSPSLGLCRACFRGLCRECATDLDRALACRSRCEPQARALVQTLDASTRYNGAVRRVSVGIAVIALLVGTFVVLWGWSLPSYHEVTLLAIPFLLIGLLMLGFSRRLSG